MLDRLASEGDAIRAAWADPAPVVERPSHIYWSPLTMGYSGDVYFSDGVMVRVETAREDEAPDGPLQLTCGVSPQVASALIRAAHKKRESDAA